MREKRNRQRVGISKRTIGEAVRWKKLEVKNLVTLFLYPCLSDATQFILCSELCGSGGKQLWLSGTETIQYLTHPASTHVTLCFGLVTVVCKYTFSISYILIE